MGRETPVSRRSRSTARLCAIVISHVERRPRVGSNRAALRHAVRKTSCVSSSAASRVPEQAQAEPVDGPAEPRVERADRVVVAGQKAFHELLFLLRQERSVVPSVHSRSFLPVYGPRVPGSLAGRDDRP